MANELTFNQLSTVLNTIVKQATGQNTVAPIDTSSFVTQAQLALNTGYDPVINSISQVLSATIFSQRPYTAKLRSLMVSNQKYGNHVRKMTSIDKDFEDDDRQKAVDGATIDMYKVNAPKVLQTNFYGEEVFQKSLTIFKDQLDCAFSSPDEFGRFISMLLGNASDMIEQAHESVGRMTVVNFIAGKIHAKNGVYHLLTEYNASTGQTLKFTDIWKPENIEPFFKFVFARVQNISDLMEERSAEASVQITSKGVVNRHTPKKNQKFYMLSYMKRLLEANVLSSVYNSSYLSLGNVDKIGYWQSIKEPEKISVTASYIDSAGAVQKTGNVAQSNIFGVLFDEEAMGITTVNQWSQPTPFNAKGGYYNQFWHFTDRYWNDLTEKGAIFVFD